MKKTNKLFKMQLDFKRLKFLKTDAESYQNIADDFLFYLSFEFPAFKAI